MVDNHNMWDELFGKCHHNVTLYNRGSYERRICSFIIPGGLKGPLVSLLGSPATPPVYGSGMSIEVRVKYL